MNEAPAPVQAWVVVALPLDDAFDLFAQGIGRWWPRAYAHGGDGFVTMTIEAVPGGRWFERNLEGQEWDWGEVRDFDPSRRIVVSLAVNPLRLSEPPGHTSEVEFRFEPAGRMRTRVVVVHHDFAAQDEDAERLREALASRQGWSFILAAYAGAARG